MSKAKKNSLTLESLFFSTPEQRVIRFLLSEPTTSHTPRVMATKLKGVRGLGGAEGIVAVLKELEPLGFVDFVDNGRGVRLRDDNPTIRLLKSFASICELEGLVEILKPISHRGFLFGSRSTGLSRTDSNFNLCVICDNPQEVIKSSEQYPMSRPVLVKTLSRDDYAELETRDAALFKKLEKGVELWGTGW